MCTTCRPGTASRSSLQAATPSLICRAPRLPRAEHEQHERVFGHARRPPLFAGGGEHRGAHRVARDAVDAHVGGGLRVGHAHRARRQTRYLLAMPMAEFAPLRTTTAPPGLRGAGHGDGRIARQAHHVRALLGEPPLGGLRALLDLGEGAPASSSGQRQFVGGLENSTAARPGAQAAPPAIWTPKRSTSHPRSWHLDGEQGQDNPWPAVLRRQPDNMAYLLAAAARRAGAPSCPTT